LHSWLDLWFPHLSHRPCRPLSCCVQISAAFTLQFMVIRIAETFERRPGLSVPVSSITVCSVTNFAPTDYSRHVFKSAHEPSLLYFTSKVSINPKKISNPRTQWSKSLPVSTL
jgi:hypothetical protein